MPGNFESAVRPATLDFAAQCTFFPVRKGFPLYRHHSRVSGNDSRLSGRIFSFQGTTPGFQRTTPTFPGRIFCFRERFQRSRLLFSMTGLDFLDYRSSVGIISDWPFSTLFRQKTNQRHIDGVRGEPLTRKSEKGRRPHKRPPLWRPFAFFAGNLYEVTIYTQRSF